LFAGNGRLHRAAVSHAPFQRGETGEAVRLVQTALLHAGLPLPRATADMTKVPDGLFGPEVEAAVKQFQQKSGLPADGRVEAATLGTLDELLLRLPAVPVRCCATGCATNKGRGHALVQALGSAFRAQAPSLASVSPRVINPLFGIQLPSGLQSLTAAQQQTAQGVFGNSLDFQLIFLSNALGLGGLPFTVALNLNSLVPIVNPIPVATIVILNVGTFTPSADLLIHELTHAWQSQHALNPYAFMTNSALSQGLAAAVGGNASAYAYLPGKSFQEYAAEQIAQQVEEGESAIIAHVASVAAWVPDARNMVSLTVPRYEILGAPGVKGV
jgi:peptidoglycan hydrolase-like protein with peptidoglycan-binding domain